MADGSRRRVIGGGGDGPLQFKDPLQLYIALAADGFVFVADSGHKCVQVPLAVLAPALDFHAFIGRGQLDVAVSVAANADSDVVVVTVPVLEMHHHSVAVFSRGDGALLRRFGCARARAAAMAACGTHVQCASCPATVTSPSPTTGTTA